MLPIAAQTSGHHCSGHKKPGARAPGWALNGPGLRLGAGREGPSGLGVQRGLRRWRGRRGLHGFLCGGCLWGRCSSLLCSHYLLGRSSFLRWCSLLGGHYLFGRSGFLCWCSLLGGHYLLGRSSFLRWCSLLGRHYLFGRSGFLCWCSLLGGHYLLGRSSFLCWCSLLGGHYLFGRSGFLCWCSLLGGHYLFGRSSFLRWCSLLGGRFFRSCHHVLLGSICKEHFLSAVDRKRSMGMEKSSIPMNTGTPHQAALCGTVCVGCGVKIHGGVMPAKRGANPRTAHHRTGIQ